MLNPHAASTDNDRKALGKVCCWEPRPKYAEFWHLNNTCLHAAGRGSECAVGKYSDIYCPEVYEPTCKYDIATIHLDRDKQGGDQNLPIYPHRDDFEQDWYFSLFYLIILTSTDVFDNEYIFPVFSQEALKTNSENKNDSKVSNLWSKYFRSLMEQFECFANEIDKFLTSHCNKKGASMKMADSNTCSGLAQIFRTGWIVRGFHSIFDYVVGSAKMIKDAGKAVAGWDTNIGGVPYGGLPPCAKDIVQYSEEFGTFVDFLFRNDKNGFIKQPLRELLVCSGLRHWDKFLDCIREHPSRRFNDPAYDFRNGDPKKHPHRGVDPNRHPFTRSVFKAVQDSGLSTSHFNQWKYQVVKQFYRNNIHAYPIPHYRKDLPEEWVEVLENEILIDCRSVVDHFNSIVATNNKNAANINKIREDNSALHIQNRYLNDRVLEMAEDLSQTRQDMAAMYRQMEHITYLLSGGQATSPPVRPSVHPFPTINTSPQRRKTPPRPQVPLNASLPDPLTVVTPYSVTAQSWADGPPQSLSTTFFLWFSDRAADGYIVDKANRSADKHKTGFGKRKKAIIFMLQFCESFPPNRPPPGQLECIQEWELLVRGMAEHAESKVLSLFTAVLEKKKKRSGPILSAVGLSAMKECTAFYNEWKDTLNAGQTGPVPNVVIPHHLMEAYFPDVKTSLHLLPQQPVQVAAHPTGPLEADNRTRQLTNSSPSRRPEKRARNTSTRPESISHPADADSPAPNNAADNGGFELSPNGRTHFRC